MIPSEVIQNEPTPPGSILVISSSKDASYPHHAFVDRLLAANMQAMGIPRDHHKATLLQWRKNAARAGLQYRRP